MLLTETLQDDEYLLHFDKEKLDERLGAVDPQSEHYITRIDVLVSPRTERRTAVAACICGNQARPLGNTDKMSYGHMIALAVLDGACPGTMLRTTVTVVPEDCSSLTPA